ncbi:hypothetical protein [Nocardiopsis sp. LOL_012]|uniref:hypothetical protein n=1 Tax=Nocardiopsis sp. LOL_012 TaxID=3345409 RepID=UPI003A8BF2BC
MGRRRPRPRKKTRPRSCGKRWFKDRISAELALVAIRSRAETTADKLPRRAYRCPDCKGWHLTSKRERPHSVRLAESGQAPGAGRVPRKAEGEWTLSTEQGLRARRAVHGMEPWVAAYTGDHAEKYGNGPTWRELEAVFGWSRWEGALIIRHLVDEGWLREVEGSPHLLPGESAG